MYRNVQRFRGGLVFKAHKLLYHSTLGLRVMKKNKKFVRSAGCADRKMLSVPGLQEYLAHKKIPMPQDHYTALGIGLR